MVRLHRSFRLHSKLDNPLLCVCEREREREREKEAQKAIVA